MVNVVELVESIVVVRKTQASRPRNLLQNQVLEMDHDVQVIAGTRTTCDDGVHAGRTILRCGLLCMTLLNQET